MIEVRIRKVWHYEPMHSNVSVYSKTQAQQTSQCEMTTNLLKSKDLSQKHAALCKSFRHSDQTSDTFKFSTKSVHLSVNYEQMQETKHSQSFHFSDFTSPITFLLSLLHLRAPTSQANTGEKQLT